MNLIHFLQALWVTFYVSRCTHLNHFHHEPFYVKGKLLIKISLSMLLSKFDDYYYTFIR